MNLRSRRLGIERRRPAAAPDRFVAGWRDATRCSDRLTTRRADDSASAWWLAAIPLRRRPFALDALRSGDVESWLRWAPGPQRLDLVANNAGALASLGLFERALLRAYASDGDWSAWTSRFVESIFDRADRDLLRAAGDALPAGDELVLYRGVAGKDPWRKENGLAWSSSPGRAAWYAQRRAHLDLADPAVLVTEIAPEAVLAHVADRDTFLIRAHAFRRCEGMPEAEPPEWFEAAVEAWRALLAYASRDEVAELLGTSTGRGGSRPLQLEEPAVALASVIGPPDPCDPG